MIALRTCRVFAATLLVGTATTLVGGCGGGGGGNKGFLGSTPLISNINGSTSPASPVNVAIEVNGTNFGATTGKVRFQQGTSPPVDVAPATSGAWTSTSILVTVPGSLAAPGSVSVSVLPVGGSQSGAVNLNLTVTPAFSPSSITWGATTALPGAVRAHAALALPTSPTSAWVYVIGGNDGTANVTSVLVASLDQNGNVGAWQATNALPAARAFHAVAFSAATNSSVPVGQTFIYVIGGQQAASDAPGGTSTVFLGTVNLSNGSVTWATSPTALPEARMGCKAAISNGFVHVTGGLNPSGGAIAQTASAPISANGTLGTFTENTPTSNVPNPVAFHETFAFGGFLYVIGGDLGPQTTPFNVASSLATNNTWFAPIRQGVVGAWQASSKTVKSREKGSLLFAFGQVLHYEGAYGNTNFEAERSSVNSDGSLGSFSGLTGGSNPNLNTFNQAGVSSPILTTGNSPRFLLIGGDSAATPGTLTNAVSRTTAP